jgi:hypothetical protein
MKDISEGKVNTEPTAELESEEIVEAAVEADNGEE